MACNVVRIISWPYLYHPSVDVKVSEWNKNAKESVKSGRQIGLNNQSSIFQVQQIHVYLNFFVHILPFPPPSPPSSHNLANVEKKAITWI